MIIVPSENELVVPETVTISLERYDELLRIAALKEAAGDYIALQKRKGQKLVYIENIEPYFGLEDRS